MSITRAHIYVSLTLALLFVPHVSEAGYTQASYYSESGYYSQGAYPINISTTTTFTGSVIENSTLSVTGTVGKGSGFFVIDHPLDPKNKLLYHSFVESPDAKNLYDGIATLDGKGEAAIQLPAYFSALNRDFRYQLKPIGSPMPQLYIKETITKNRFVIGGGAPNGRVSWQVSGTRHDAFIRANPIRVEVNKGPDALTLKGAVLFKGYSVNFPTQRIVEYIRTLLAE